MRYRSITPLLRTKQLKETINFYTSILGFTCNNENEEWGWASLSKDEVQLMVATPNARTPFEQPMFTGSFYFEVEKIGDLWEQLRNKATICYPLEHFDYGMNEFAIYDNNGYLLQFGEREPSPGTVPLD